MTIFVEFDQASADALKATLGEDAKAVGDLTQLRSHLSESTSEDAVVLGPSVDLKAAAAVAEEMRLARPALGVILVRRRVDTQTLTEALHSGMRDVVAEDDLSGLAQAVRRAQQLAAKFSGAGDIKPAKRGEIVTIFSAKGGCGKTSLATNLAVVLAEDNSKSVALVDLDLQFGDVAISMHLAPNATWHDAVRIGDSLDAQAMRSLMTQHSSNVSVLAAPLDPSQADGIDIKLIHQALQIMATEFDYVVVDCPPALDDLVLTAFDASTTVALMATLDVPALKNMKLTLETLKLIDYPTSRLRIVVNRADSKVGLDVGDVERTIGLPVAARIPSSVDVPFAANRGVVLASESPHHAVSAAVRSFAYELTRTATPPAVDGAQTEPVAATSRKTSRWRRNS